MMQQALWQLVGEETEAAVQSRASYIQSLVRSTTPTPMQHWGLELSDIYNTRWVLISSLNLKKISFKVLSNYPSHLGSIWY